MNKTSIPWADLTWNPITGCTKGCEYCYARAIARRFYGNALEDMQMPHHAKIGYPAFPWGFEPTIYPHRLDEPLRLKKPSRIFLGSMGDLFDPAFPDEFRDRVFATVDATPQHTYLLLTKQPENMRRYFRRGIIAPKTGLSGSLWEITGQENLWIGVTVTNQADADERIPLLLDTPAAHRFVSVEPTLGPVDLTALRREEQDPTGFLDTTTNVFTPMPLTFLDDALRGRRAHKQGWSEGGRRLDAVIVGAKTPGKPLHGQNDCLNCARFIDNQVNDICDRADCEEVPPGKWLRSLRDQCLEAGVPFHYKHGKDNPALDGVVYDWRPGEGRR